MLKIRRTNKLTRRIIFVAVFLITSVFLISSISQNSYADSIVFTEDFSTEDFKFDTTNGGLWAGDGVFTADTTSGVQISFKNPSPGYGFWDDVDFVSSTVGWLLDSDTIMKTNDGGVTWEQQQTAIADSVDFLNLLAVSDTVVYIATTDEKIIKTTDGGATWGNVIFDDSDFQDDDYVFSAIDCVDANTCFVGGVSGDNIYFLISTTDGFDTFSVDWDPGDTDCKVAEIIDIDFTSATDGWFIGDNEICKTEDGGLNFTTQLTGAGTTFTDIEMFDVDTGWAVGSGGKIYATVDGGDNWDLQVCTGCGDLTAVDAFNVNIAWVTDEDNNELRKTTDGGADWDTFQQASPFGGGGPIELDIVSATEGFFVGSQNNDFAMMTDGTNWTDETDGIFPNNISDIDFSADGFNGWTASGSLVGVSTDSGETWAGVNPLIAGAPTLNSIDFVDGNDGWAVGTLSTIAYSADGGATWVAQAMDGGPPGTFNSVSVDPACALPPTCVAIAGGTGNVYYTADGGATNWLNSDVAVNILAVHMLDSLTGFAVSGIGQIFKTVNAGANFTEVYDAGAMSLLGIDFASATVGIVVGSEGTILRTDDAGDTWSVIGNPTGANDTFEEVSFYDANNGFIVSSTTGGAPFGGEVLITSDGGLTWTESDGGFLVFSSVKALGADEIWIAGNNGVVSKSYLADITETDGHAYSLDVDTTSEDIVEVTLTADEVVVPNTGFVYSVSNNGIDFYTVTPGVPFRFPGVGSNLQFQVTALSGSLTDIPVLNELSLDYTTNAVPDAPIFSAPTNGASGVSKTSTVFSFSSTDADINDLYYVLEIATDAAFTSGRHSFDQRQNGTGWSQDGPYDSGDTATFTLPDGIELAGNATYYARVSAIDTFESSATSVAISFSTTESEPVTDTFETFALLNTDTITAALASASARFNDAMFDTAGVITMQFSRSLAGAASIGVLTEAGDAVIDLVDFDRDGILDLFHAGAGSDNVNFLENYFSGGGLDVNITAQGNVNDLNHGNFDYDDYIDLVIASGDGIKIVSFGDPATGELANGATTDVEVADIDRDGKDEIIVSGSEAMDPIEELVSFGVYQASAPTGLDTSNFKSIAADFDLDGDIDIAHGQTTAALDPGNHLYIRGADGTYTKTSDVFGDDTTETDDIIASDLDMDGDMDVVVAHGGLAGNVDFYINDGGADFTLSDPLALGAQINKTELADIDLDGDADLLVASDDELAIYSNRGNNVFELSVNAPSEITYVIARDVDGDAGVDILYTDETGSPTDIMQADVAYTTSDTAVADFGDNIATGDIDGDGDLDAISSTAAEVNQHINNGDGTFTTSLLIGAPANTSAPALYDVDADGDLDAIFGSATLLLAFNPGDGFGGAYDEASLGASTYARYIFSDIDIDGDADILMQKAAGGVDWFRNDGGTTFSDQGALGSATIKFITLDYDLDGDEDPWELSNDTEHPYKNGTWVSQNDGGLVFSNVHQLFNKTVGERFHSLGVTADFDADGDADVFEAGEAVGESIFWWNKGNGEFSSLPLVDYARIATHLFTYDFDGDGDLDIFLGDTINDETDILINSGKHDFSLIPNIPVSAKAIARIHNYGPASILYTGGYYDYLPTFDDTDVTVRSLELDSTTSIIRRATLTVQDYAPAGTDIVYLLSSDGGLTWEGPITSGVEFSFSSSDDLRWRADLSTTDPELSPVIYGMSIVWAGASGGGGGGPGSTAAVPSAPTPLVPYAVSTESIAWPAVNTSSDVSGFLIKEIVDSTSLIKVTTGPEVFVVAKDAVITPDLVETGLNVNTQYCNRYIFASNDNGNSLASTVFPCVYTLANPPVNMVVAAIDKTTAHLSWELNSNPTETEFSIKEKQSGLWVNAEKNLTSDSAVWISFNEWGGEGGTDVIGLSDGESYDFQITSRNGDGVEDGNVEASVSVGEPELAIQKSAQVITQTFAVLNLSGKGLNLVSALRGANTVSDFGWPSFLILALAGGLMAASSREVRRAHIFDIRHLPHLFYHSCLSEKCMKKGQELGEEFSELVERHSNLHGFYRKSVVGVLFFSALKGASLLTLALLSGGGVFALGTIGTPVHMGDTISYTLNIGNVGTAKSVDARVIDALSPLIAYLPGSIYVNGQFKSDALADDEAGYNAPERKIEISIPEIDVGENVTVKFKGVVVGSESSVLNSASGTDSTGKIVLSNIVENQIVAPDVVIVPPPDEIIPPPPPPGGTEEIPAGTTVGGDGETVGEEGVVAPPVEEQPTDEVPPEEEVQTDFVTITRVDVNEESGIVTVLGTGVPGDEVIIAVDGSGIGTATVDENGMYVFIFSLPGAGRHAISVFSKTQSAQSAFDVSQKPILVEIKEVIDEFAKPSVIVLLLSTAVASLGNLLPLWLYFVQFLTHPFIFFGRRKWKYWGTVYNSISKMPVDLAIVRLIDAQTGAVVQTQVTDKSGRYLFFASRGIYKIEAQKSGYASPSTYVNISPDASFNDVYVSQFEVVGENTSVVKAVPIDVVNPPNSAHDVNSVQSIYKWKYFAALLGPLVSVAVLIYNPSVFTAVLVALHVALFSLFYRFGRVVKPKSFGVVKEAATGKTIKNVLVRIFEPTYNKLLDSKLTDANGSYGFLVGQNKYYLTFNAPGYAEARTGIIDLTSAREPQAISQNFTLNKINGV